MKDSMRRIFIIETAYDPAQEQFSGLPVCAFVVGTAGIDHVEFGDDLVPSDVSIADPESGEVVRLADNPLRWADLLPLAFRAGDYTVLVAEHAEPRLEPVVSEPAPAPALAVVGETTLDVQSFG